MPIPLSLKKWIKIALWTAGAFAALLAVAVVIAAIIIPKKYPPEKVRAMVTEQLAAKIHRKIQLKDARFNLFSGFRLSGLSVSNRPGWTDRPFLAADDVSITYRLLPLLWLQLELGEIKLEKPVIFVERQGGPNEYNFTDLMGGASAPPQEAPAAQSEAVNRALMLFTVAKVNIHQGRITYVDHLSKPAFEIDMPGADLTVKNISLSGAKTSFEFNSPLLFGGTTYKMSVKGAERLNWDKQAMKDVKVEGEFQGIKFSLSGSAQNIVDDFAPDFTGEASLDMAQAAALMPKTFGPLPKDLALSGTFNLPFTVGGSLKKGFAVGASADLTSADIVFGSMFKKPKGTVAKAEFKVVSGSNFLKVPSYNASLGAWTVKGSASFTGMEQYPGDPKANPEFAFAISAPSLPLKALADLAPMLKDYTLTGDMGMDISMSGSVKRPQSGSLRGSVDFRGLNVSAPHQAKFVEDVTGHVALTDTSIDLPSMKFKLMGAPASFMFKMSRFHAGELADFGKCNALIVYNLDAADIDLEKAMQSMGVTTGTSSGGTKAAASKTAPVDLRTSVSPGLQVNGRMSFKSFYFKKLKLSNAVATMTVLKRQMKMSASVAGFSGKASMVFAADMNRAPLPYAYSLALQGVSAQTAINDGVESFVAKNPGNYEDKVTGVLNFQMKGSGYMDADPAASAQGDGTFAVTGVQLKGISLLGGLSQSLKDNPSSIKFDRLDGTLKVGGNKVAITAKCNGTTMRLRVNGAVGFNGIYAPEMLVQSDIQKGLLDSKALFGALPDSLRQRIDLNRAADAQGYVPVDFKLTGPANQSPGLKALDPTRLTKNVTASYARQLGQKAGAQAQKAGAAVGNALKGLFGK